MRIVLLVSILCVILGSLVSGQTATCDLSVGYFSQTTTLYQAQAQGFLSKTGISICTGAVTGSVQAYQGLASGQYHILQSATDNAVSRYYLPSAYPGQNVTLLGQMDGSALQILAVHWDIEKIEDLRGKNIVVDSPVSGLIFNLRRLLAVHNLYYPRDYNMVPLGANRFGAVQNGYLTDSNGVRIPISATVLAPPQSTQIIQNPNAYAGQVRNLGIIESDVAPVAGTSLQTDPNHLLNPVKSVNINKFMGAILLARRFVLNPANKAAVIAGLKALQPLNDAQAEVAYQYSINDKLVGETIVDLSFDRYAFGNGVFYKATFDDRYNNVNYADGYFSTGFGRLIDYGPRDAGLIIADQLAAITVSIENLPQYNNICVYPANRDYSYKVNNALSGLLSASSGGCINLKSVFASCSTDDLTAAPIDCQYDVTNDVLTINAKSTGSSRVYNVKYSVEDACQYKVPVIQTVTIYKSASDAPSGSNCVNLQPACSVTVSSRSVATWSRDGSSYAQYSLSINNPSAGNVNSVILQLSASDAANLETVWAMRSLGNNKYSLLLAGRSIAPDSTYTLAGYIAKNGPLNFSPSTVTCQ